LRLTDTSLYMYIGIWRKEVTLENNV